MVCVLKHLVDHSRMRMRHAQSTRRNVDIFGTLFYRGEFERAGPALRGGRRAAPPCAGAHAPRPALIRVSVGGVNRKRGWCVWHAQAGPATPASAIGTAVTGAPNHRSPGHMSMHTVHRALRHSRQSALMLHGPPKLRLSWSTPKDVTTGPLGRSKGQPPAVIITHQRHGRAIGAQHHCTSTPKSARWDTAAAPPGGTRTQHSLSLTTSELGQFGSGWTSVSDRRQRRLGDCRERHSLGCSAPCTRSECVATPAAHNCNAMMTHERSGAAAATVRCIDGRAAPTARLRTPSVTCTATRSWRQVRQLRARTNAETFVPGQTCRRTGVRASGSVFTLTPLTFTVRAGRRWRGRGAPG